MAKDKEIVVEPVVNKELGIRVLPDAKGMLHEYSVLQIGDSFECTPHSFAGETEIRDSI